MSQFRFYQIESFNCPYFTEEHQAPIQCYRGQTPTQKIFSPQCFVLFSIICTLVITLLIYKDLQRDLRTDSNARRTLLQSILQQPRAILDGKQINSFT